MDRWLFCKNGGRIIERRDAKTLRAKQTLRLRTPAFKYALLAFFFAQQGQRLFLFHQIQGF